MLTYLLKSALPFTLTFALGAALGGFLFNPFGSRTRATRIVRTELHDYSHGKGRGCKQKRFKRRELVAETKPLVILFKPDARWPRELDADNDYAKVSVTFGADGKVQKVGIPDYGALTGVQNNVIHHRGVRVAGLELPPLWKAVEKAAWQIQFEPETINGVPVSVTKDIEIRFMRD
ncbi:MAG: hypothetical protein H7Z38_01570 [Rubrivivax sp.]|nr:hypothetical protein [Pyrinomonadaceae bacterium]